MRLATRLARYVRTGRDTCQQVESRQADQEGLMGVMDRREYARRYGPTVGDRVRLADTDLWVEGEADGLYPGGGGGGGVREDGGGGGARRRAGGGAGRGRAGACRQGQRARPDHAERAGA